MLAGKTQTMVLTMVLNWHSVWNCCRLKSKPPKPVPCPPSELVNHTLFKDVACRSGFLKSTPTPSQAWTSVCCAPCSFLKGVVLVWSSPETCMWFVRICGAYDTLISAHVPTTIFITMTVSFWEIYQVSPIYSTNICSSCTGFIFT